MFNSNHIDRAQCNLYALLESMPWWVSGRIVPSHGTDPSSNPDQCNDQNVWI